ncbi:MAG TPA: MBL fold metallo-hydrolase [Ramlibacter sp.]|nr:MBL fold metallo-hydrolase [Ramlibacter sp.]
MGLLPPGVHVMERGWLSANNVLLIGRDSTALVDSGYCTHATQTLELLRRRLGERRLDCLVNTHLHSDHCGGNAALQQAYPGLRTFIPPGHAEEVQRWDAVALTYVSTGQSCPPFTFSDVLHPGETLALGDREWEVLAAPGHDPHAAVLFDSQSGTLLAGDALWENGFGVVFPELEGEHAFEEVAATLDVIEHLRPALVVPGHGGVFTDVPMALGRARSRLDAYRADPRKHAAHAAKVLLKFRLLELQRVDYPEFSAWAMATPYFRIVRNRWFPDEEISLWLKRLLAELEAAGAARLTDGFVVNM